jgi:hypothetical protein
VGIAALHAAKGEAGLREIPGVGAGIASEIAGHLSHPSP